MSLSRISNVVGNLIRKIRKLYVVVVVSRCVRTILVTREAIESPTPNEIAADRVPLTRATGAPPLTVYSAVPLKVVSRCVDVWVSVAR